MVESLHEQTVLLVQACYHDSLLFVQIVVVLLFKVNLNSCAHLLLSDLLFHVVVFFAEPLQSLLFRHAEAPYPDVVAMIDVHWTVTAWYHQQYCRCQGSSRSLEQHGVSNDPCMKLMLFSRKDGT